MSKLIHKIRNKTPNAATMILSRPMFVLVSNAVLGPEPACWDIHHALQILDPQDIANTLIFCLSSPSHMQVYFSIQYIPHNMHTVVLRFTFLWFCWKFIIYPCDLSTRLINPLHAKFFRGSINMYILCHPPLTWHRELKSDIMLDEDLPILYSQYHGCWCPGDARSQGINNHDIYYV